MVCHIPIGRVEVRLIPACMRYPGKQIVRDDYLGYTSEILQCMDMHGYPVMKPLTVCCLGIRVVACTQYCYKYLRFLDLTAVSVRYRYRCTAVVYKQLLSCLVILTHNKTELACPFIIKLTKPGILVSLRMFLFILLP